MEGSERMISFLVGAEKFMLLVLELEYTPRRVERESKTRGMLPVDAVVDVGELPSCAAECIA